MKYKGKIIAFFAGIIIIAFITLFPIESIDIDTTIGIYRQNGFEVTANDLQIIQGIPETQLNTLTLTNTTIPVDSEGNSLKDEKAIQEPNLVLLLFEQQEQLDELKLNFSTTKSYNDGTTTKKPISQLDLTLNTLDFIVVSDDPKPITDGKIDVILEEFSQGFKDSNLVVDYFINDEFKETIQMKIQQKGTTIKTIKADELFSTNEQGTKKVKLVARELYIVTPSGNFYLPTATTLYEAEFTKDITQTLVKNEKGEFVKIYDTDIPFTFATVSDANVQQICQRKTAYGCYKYSSFTIYKINPGASATILDSDGKIFASASAGRGSCLQFYQNAENSQWCLKSPSSTVISTKLQRGQTYTFKPDCLGSHAITINVPTDKNISYYYYCSNSAHNFNT